MGAGSRLYIRPYPPGEDLNGLEVRLEKIIKKRDVVGRIKVE